jgi:hypothetical protein
VPCYCRPRECAWLVGGWFPTALSLFFSFFSAGAASAPSRRLSSTTLFLNSRPPWYPNHVYRSQWGPRNNKMNNCHPYHPKESAAHARHPYRINTLEPTEVPMTWPIKSYIVCRQHDSTRNDRKLRTESTNTAFNLDRASIDILNVDAVIYINLPYSVVTTYPRAEVVNDTCSIWVNKSIPRQAMMGAATLRPPAASWTL